MAREPAPPEPLPIGYRWHDRYLVEAELAPQSMGRAYRVSDTRLHEVVVINVVYRVLRDKDDVIRFRMCFRKARTAHGDAVHDYGEYLGAPYVTVKYVDGLGAAVDVGKASQRGG